MDNSVRRGNKEHGFALFAVLSFLLLATAIAAPLVTNARSSALIARNVAADLKDRALADSLFLLAGAEISSRSQQPDFELPRSVKCTAEQTSIQVDILNHAGFIDLNAASADLLHVGFLAAGFEATTAEELAQTVVQYRSVEQTPGTARTVTVRGGLKHRLFESVDELHDFQTDDKDLSPDYRRIFTTHTATGTILNSALPQSVETVLKTLLPESAYFVVSGSPPLVALTISVSVSRPGKRLLIASIELGPNAAEGLQRLSPLRIDMDANQMAPRDTSSSVSACEALFSPAAQELIRALVVEGAG